MGAHVGPRACGCLSLGQPVLQPLNALPAHNAFRQHPGQGCLCGGGGGVVSPGVWVVQFQARGLLGLSTAITGDTT